MVPLVAKACGVLTAMRVCQLMLHTCNNTFGAECIRLNLVDHLAMIDGEQRKWFY